MSELVRVYVCLKHFIIYTGKLFVHLSLYLRFNLVLISLVESFPFFFFNYNILLYLV